MDIFVVLFGSLMYSLIHPIPIGSLLLLQALNNKKEKESGRKRGSQLWKYIPVTTVAGSQKQASDNKFKAALVYVQNLTMAKATRRDSTSKNKTRG